MADLFYTSDTHYHHENIIAYCKRPFSNIVEMHDHLVWAWNERVKKGDTVFHLGDFGFGSAEGLRTIRDRLNGRIILVKGNHDKSNMQMLLAGMDAVYNSMTVKTERGMVYMRHKPDLFGEWKKTGAAYHLCGHVHTEWERKENVINVGVDVRDFAPQTLDDLLSWES